MINDKIKYLGKLKELNLGSKNENEIGNRIEDEGFFGILNNAKYLKNLEKLYLQSRL